MKEKFIKSTIILLFGGLITKVLGMLIKIIMSRLIGTNGLSLYMLILPTFSLFINLSQFGIPIALVKLISENNKSSKKLLFSIIPLTLIINIILMITIILISPIISNNLLHNPKSYLGIISIAFVIPFTSISSICRSYFFGKEKMLPHIISNITEDIIRLLLMIIGIPIYIKKGIEYAVCYIILSNIISELTSIFILLFFLPKNITITKKELKPNKNYMKEALSISIPNTTSRLIGSIGYFLEPIILTTTLKKHYNLNYITTEYGIISGYIIPIILLPSFFTLAISQALLPVVSKEYSKGNKPSTRKKIKQAITISLLIGIPITILLTSYPSFFINLIYHTNQGINYMKILAPICIFQYIQSPLSFSLDAMGKSKDVLISSIIGTITRTITLLLLSPLKIGLYSLIISIRSLPVSSSS